VGLIQRAAEAAGFCTISMGNEPERMAKIKPPRALRVKFGRGSMFGEPGNVERQRRIVLCGCVVPVRRRGSRRPDQLCFGRRRFFLLSGAGRQNQRSKQHRDEA
jgi:hypothetical protein